MPLSREIRKDWSLRGSDITGRAGCGMKSTGWKLGCSLEVAVENQRGGDR